MGLVDRLDARERGVVAGADLQDVAGAHHLAGQEGIDQVAEDLGVLLGHAGERAAEPAVLLIDVDHARIQAHDHLELLEREDQPDREPLAGLARGDHAFHAEAAERPVVDLIAHAVDLDLDRDLEPDVLAMDLELVHDLGLHERSSKERRHAQESGAQRHRGDQGTDRQDVEVGGTEVP